VGFKEIAVKIFKVIIQLFYDYLCKILRKSEKKLMACYVTVCFFFSIKKLIVNKCEN